MNVLLENGTLKEMLCGSNFAYILSDSNNFLSTEYKVLQSQQNSCFVKCMKMLYNGEIMLYYMTQTLKPLTALLPTIDAESFVTLVSNLLADIIDVKSNGFLSCKNIDITFDRIYVDPTTYKVSLVYLPLCRSAFEDVSDFENELRTGLVKLISAIARLSSPRTLQLRIDLSDGKLSLAELYGRLKGGKIGWEKDTPVANIGKTSGIRIVALNAPVRVDLSVNSDSFIIGKKQGMADVVVSFNDKISRAHCRIERHGNQFSVTDLKSANGTFINKNKLKHEQAYPIRNGDILRLANSDFQVYIG